MNKKILIGIVISIFTIALVVVFSRGPLYVPRTDNQGMMTNLAQTNNVVYLKLASVSNKFYNDIQFKGPFTLFVPTDQALAQLPKGELAILQQKDRDDTWARSNFLAAHMVIGEHPSASLKNGMVLGTLQGKKITLIKKGNTWYIDNTIRIVQSDIKSKNGIIYLIDGVIIPKPY